MNITHERVAELFLGRDTETAQLQGALRFGTAADAIRFALEQAAPVSLRAARLVVGPDEFKGEEIRQLYAQADFPLRRKAA